MATSVSDGRPKNRDEDILRAAFLAGAVTDAGALLPMPFPSFAGLLWGFHEVSGAYRFAMGDGASLMLGWTCCSCGRLDGPSKDGLSDLSRCS